MTLLGSVSGLMGGAGSRARCWACRREVKAILDLFREEFLSLSQDGILTPQDKQHLWKPVLAAGVAREEALPVLQGAARQAIERILSSASANGAISQPEEQMVLDVARSAALPPSYMAQIQARIEPFKAIGRIREGHLPVVECDLCLEADEVCHLNVPAVYHKVGKSSTTLIAGQMVATTRRIRFLSAQGGWAVQYKNVMRVSKGLASVNLKLAVRQGNGSYNLQNPLLCEAILSTLTRMSKRQMLAPKGEGASRHIPQHVKQAVWGRDGGRCVECGDDDYLEFDHIIPHSKGGASTLNNVQLLCRRCNNAKSDRL